MANAETNGKDWSVASIREALAAKRISARELTSEFYARIEKRNPELKAYLALCPERAYEQADRVDAMWEPRRVAAAGRIAAGGKGRDQHARRAHHLRFAHPQELPSAL